MIKEGKLMSHRVAVLGLGRMGRELARHVQADGHDVVAFNRTIDEVHRGALPGVAFADTAADAVADADVIVSVLFGPDAVRELIVDSDLALPSGSLWIDVTTISAADAREFATWAESRSISHVHAPVVGSLGPARAGMLGVLLGGPATAVEQAKEITRSWADPSRVHSFESASEAASAKLVVNLGLAVATQALAEAILLGESCGLSLEVMLAVLEKTPLAGVVAAKASTLLSGNFVDAQFTVDALAKDLKLAVASTSEHLPAVQAAQSALARQQLAGHGSWDFSVIASDQ